MKKLLILVFLFLLTGCTVQYDLTITNKEEVREKFYIYVSNEVIYNNSMEIDEYLDYYSNLYMQNKNYKDLTIKTKESKPSSYFLVEKKYSSLDKYVESYTFKNMFNNAQIERIGNYISFTTSKNMFLDSIQKEEILSEETLKNEYKISIKFYNEISNHNADSFDEKNNILTWNVNKNTEKDYIYFKIGPTVRYDVMIMDYLQNNMLLIIILGSILLIILIAIITMFIKFKKTNEI